MNPLDTIKNIINKGKAGVLFQSPNPLLRAVPAKPKTPVVFGISSKPTVTPIVPRTANTTKQTVSPVPMQAPVVPPPPINPIDIIRNGKTAVIRAPQGSEATTPVRKDTILNRALFGSEQDRKAQADIESRGGKVPFTAKMTSGGILGTIAPSFARTAKERQEATSQALIEKGIDPNRAIEIAYQKDMSNGALIKTPDEMKRSKEAEKALEALNLTPDEKNVLLKRKVVDAGETALDVTTFGVGGTVRNVGKGAIKTVLKGAELDIAEQAIDIARGTSKLDKEVQAEVMKKAQDIADREQFPNRVGSTKALANDFEAVLQNKPAKAEPLQEEAKKYKSAEEFVKAQGTPVYHGTGEGISFTKFDTTKAQKGNRGKQVYLTESKVAADWFSKLKSQTNYLRSDEFRYGDGPNKGLDFTPNTLEFIVPKKAKIKTLDKLPQQSAESVIAQLKKDGYDGVKFTDDVLDTIEGQPELADAFVNGKSPTTVIMFDPDKLLSRTELTDIWKNANTPVNQKLADFKAGKPSSSGGYIANPLGGKPKPLVKDNQVVSSGNDSIRLSPIDKLIADNKVRVVSRDGRDVYQVKKGSEWKSVRDEDSAVKQATPKSPIDVIRTTKTPKVVRTEAQYKATPEQIKDYENRLTVLSGAEAGERLVKNNADGTFGGFVGKGSTFPSYVDQDLRSRKLFDRYLDGRSGTASDFNIVYPKGSKLARLDKIIKGQVGVKETKIRQMVRARAIPTWEKNASEQVAREQRQAVRQTEPQFRSVLDLPTPVPKAEVTGLEKASRPNIDEVRPSTPYKAESLQDIITKTPLDRKVNIVDYLRTPDRVLNKIGFGKEAKLLRDQYEKYSKELPKNIDKISGWVNRVPANASERIFQHLDGKVVQLSNEEQKVADEIRVYLKDWADRLGLPEENRVANYITRLFDDQLIKQEFDEDLAKIISGKIPGEVYNPFLQKRLGAKGYKQDVWGALDAYTKRATRKVHIDPALERIRDKAGSSLEFTNLEESQFKYIQRYIDRVQMRPTELDNAIDNTVKQVLGYKFGQRPVTTISRFLRRMTYRGMLGGNLSSALRNLSQGVNTYAVLGEKYTTIGYAKLLQPASRKELLEQGIFNNNFIEDRVLSSTKKILQKGDKALWFFFDQAEKINRGSAYLGAKAKGIGMGLNEQEAIDYAKSIVRKTQFSYDAVDQPVALGSDIMKTIFQFQTYTTKQTEFLSEIVKGAVKGDKKMQNVLSLLRYGLGGYVFVNTVGKALGMTMGEMIPLYQNLSGEREISVAPSLKFPIEVVKAVADTPDKYGNDRDLEQKMKDVGKSVIGLIPGGNQAKKTIEGLETVEKGGSFDKAGKLQFEQGTSTASKVQSILFGKYASQKAKDYFDKKTTKTGDKELDNLLKEQKDTQATTTEKATTDTLELSKLTPDEQKAKLQELAKTDKDYAIKLRDKLREQNRQKTWSEVDKGINKLGVENGARANYVYKKMRELPGDQRNAYIKDLRERKVISDEVYKQIQELHKNRDIIE